MNQGRVVHQLRFAPGNIHVGYYSSALKPVMRIVSGDTVRIETGVPASWLEPGVPREEIPQSSIDVEKSISDAGPGGHYLTGPIYVEGAEPGDILEVKILSYEHRIPYGLLIMAPNFASLPEEFPYVKFKVVKVDTTSGIAKPFPGVTLKLSPFFGSIGVAPPPIVGKVSSNPPGLHTGNIDNKELVAGSTLYMPVHVPGALLSAGDPHLAQGDGEVSGAALEGTGLTGTLQIIVKKGNQLRWPRAETFTHYITMGLHADLDEAAKVAVREMIDYLVTEKAMSRDDALLLCSVAVDLHVTQIVDGTKGIHAMLPKSIFR